MTELYNGLPLFEALVNDEGTGIDFISIVSDPAIEISFFAFEKTKEYLKYSVVDEEKRRIIGPVMIPDLPIYRRSPEIGEYYVVYSKDTIRKMAEKLLREGNQNNVDIQHNGENVSGVDAVQFFIKDSKLGINPSGFEDIADGTLFSEFHVYDNELWSRIKDGELSGFSLSGVFTIEPKQYTKETNELDDVRSLVHKIFNRLT